MSDAMDLSVEWLRELARKGGKGVVGNIDARSLGRIADEIADLRAKLEVEQRERKNVSELYLQSAKQVLDLIEVRDKAEARVAELEAALRDTLAVIRDKRWAQIIGDYYGRGHLSYAGQLNEKFGPIERALASRAAEAPKEPP